jgi:fructokinase
VIMVCGEALIDLVPAGRDLWRALPGGSPANTAIAAARLGGATTLLARLSSDPFGSRLREHLTANNVDLRYARDADEPTTLAVVDLDEHGAAQYTFHLNGTADWGWSASELPALSGTDVSVIHAGSMALLIDPGGPILEAFLAAERQHRIISVDPNVRSWICPEPARYAEHVRRWLGLAHIVKASLDDVAWLYPGRSAEDTLDDWMGCGPDVVVITLGGRGAVARLRDGSTVRVAAPSVDVVDTVGAGDTFSAAFLHALSAHRPLSVATLPALCADQVAAALDFGARAAAITCSRRGADPPYAHEMEARTP